MGKRLITLIFLGCICCNLSINAVSKPVLVMGSVRINQVVLKTYPEWVWNIYPEFAVDENGIWREATLSDFWIGQKFDAYTENNQNLIYKNRVEIESFGKYQGYLKQEKNPKEYCDDDWGIYLGQKGLKFKGNGKEVFGKAITDSALKDLLQKNSKLKDKLNLVVKDDFNAIKKDFPVQFNLNIWGYMSGDINGDKITDYIINLGNYYSKSTDEFPGAIVIAYISDQETYKRYPIDFWKEADDNYGFPMLLFVKDLNNDGTDELFISDADSDTTRPIIYAWDKDKLIQLYAGHEIWQ